MSISPFAIKLTVGEMDVMAVFFILCSMLFFVRGLKSPSKKLFLFSGISLGLALYTKVYPVLFVPSLLIHFIVHNKKTSNKLFTKQNVQNISIFLLTIFIFAIPSLTHNFLLYQDKGFVDLQYTRSLGLGKDISEKYYGWDHQFNAKNDWDGLIFGGSSNYGNLPTPTLWLAINYIRIANPFIFYLFLLCLIYMIFSKTNRSYLVFFGISILFALPFLASIILLPKHYLFIDVLMVPLVSKFIAEISEKFKWKLKFKLIHLILIVAIIASFIGLGLAFSGTTPHFFGESAVNQFIEFKNEKISESSLLVVDSRIYHGQMHWMAYGRPYIEGTGFIDILNIQSNLPGTVSNIPVYFVECVSDDCGWGSIKDQPDLNKSMENLTSVFKEKGILVKEINEPNKDLNYYPFQEEKLNARLRVYVASIPLKDSILNFASNPKEWFLYKIGYGTPSSQFDYFKTDTFFKNTLFSLARFVVLISMILSLILLFYIFYQGFLVSSKEQSNS
jgi:hypothetical protein